MAGQKLKLNRQQLQQFLPNHEAIKAFESLFEYVNDTGPAAVDDLTAIIATLKNPGSAATMLAKRIDELEMRQTRLAANYNAILTRLNELAAVLGV